MMRYHHTNIGAISLVLRHNATRGRLALTNWGWVTHICVGNLTIIGSENGLSPERHQAIIWTNAGILLIVPLGTNFSEISIGIQTFSFKKMHFKMSLVCEMASILFRPQCVEVDLLSRTLNCQRQLHVCVQLCVRWDASSVAGGFTSHIYPYHSEQLHWQWGKP